MGKKRRTRRKKAGRRSSRGELKPVKMTAREVAAEPPDEGPRSWFLPRIEEAYSRLAPADQPTGPAAAALEDAATALAAAGSTFESSLQPGAGEAVLGQTTRTHWRDVLSEYRRRKAATVTALAVEPLEDAAPFVPGARNWRPLGPQVVLEGQTVGSNPVAGRVCGVAVAPGGDIVYVATAAGGVFRSDDGGTTWRSLMDGFDVDPTDFASASLACGAIAIDGADPDRVYVGSGEGDTHEMFRRRIVGALPAYRGIGPIRSDDGGDTWVTESTAADSPELAGDAFFALAVDPTDRENVIAATTLGLYQRVPASGAGFEWVLRRPGVHSSVVVVSSGSTTRFFAAEWGEGVFHSTNGETWRRTGTGFPSDDVGRIALGVQPGRTRMAYAFVADERGGLHGVYRLDAVGGSWAEVADVPEVLPGGQGGYDLAIAVDPERDDLIYLGGDRGNAPPWPGSVWRCEIGPSGSALEVIDSVSIGTHAHADIHVVTHTPGEPAELWCGCDGGLFLNRNPRGDGQFASRNDGLACLCSNFIAQHPTDPSIMFTGLQDNGTARTSSGAIWTHVSGGDGGYCLINWADTDQVLVFANGRVYRSTSGGSTHDSWSTVWNFPWATMTQPIVGPPFDPASPSDANLVAVGAGQHVFFSDNFAASWTMSSELPVGSGSVFALAFGSPERLFVGTTLGRVFRLDRSGDDWIITRLDDASGGALGLVGLVTDVAVDWADLDLESVYVSFGGLGDRRRVWRFDGNAWEVRSGTVGVSDLLDVEHNALCVDPEDPDNLYVGADIGVWHSADRGLNWDPLQNGLPDAPVFDLQIHPTQRLLRAATHGRGLYEIRLD